MRKDLTVRINKFEKKLLQEYKQIAKVNKNVNECITSRIENATHTRTMEKIIDKRLNGFNLESKDTVCIQVGRFYYNLLNLIASSHNLSIEKVLYCIITDMIYI